MTMYIVMTRVPIKNSGAYVVWARAIGAELQNSYYSEYADETQKEQYIAVGPCSSGDARKIYDLMSAGNGKPIILEVKENGI